MAQLRVQNLGLHELFDSGQMLGVEHGEEVLLVNVRLDFKELFAPIGRLRCDISIRGVLEVDLVAVVDLI